MSTICYVVKYVYLYTQTPLIRTPQVQARLSTGWPQGRSMAMTAQVFHSK